MKRLILAFAVVFGLAAAVSAAAPAPLTTLRAIHALTNAEADHGLPVAFEATVTYYNSGLYTLFVQDDGAGIYVRPPQNAKLVMRIGNTTRQLIEALQALAVRARDY